MSKPTAKYLLAIALLGTGISTAIAHTTVLPKNTPDRFAQRVELEGSSSVLNHFSIPHGCAAPGSTTSNPVRAMSTVFPNGAEAIAQRDDTGEAIALAEIIEGNAIMSPAPVQDHNIFKKIRVLKGPVPTFHSHCVRNEDVRAFHYNKGKLSTDLIGLMPFRASFPGIKADSCVTQLRVNIAIANYCTHSQGSADRADIWMGVLTERFNDPDVVSTGFWPYTKVVRDTAQNPLPSSCGDGYTVTVSPSPASIDRYLPIHGYWPAAGRGHGSRDGDARHSDD